MNAHSIVLFDYNTRNIRGNKYTLPATCKANILSVYILNYKSHVHFGHRYINLQPDSKITQ